jgi:DnaK suppressor protein
MKPEATGERERYETLDRMLRDRRAESEVRLRALREAMPPQAADVKDAEEQSVEDFARDMHLSLMEMETATVRRIEEALQRLAAGTYGVCASCQQPIAEARLQALPFATRCRDCQEREEVDGRAARLVPRLPHEEPPRPQRLSARQRDAMQIDPVMQKTIRMMRART